MSWDNEQHFEAGWWGDCANTLGEQFKHPTYARLMGLQYVNDGGRYLIDAPGQAILDIGGGPCSMLLNTRGAARRTVIDPCNYPVWTQLRYEAAGIELVQQPAEDFTPDQVYDEAWCYNCLQHVKNPQAIITMMRAHARVVRMFEWVNEPAHEGHPHELRSDQLAEWLGFGEGNASDGWWDETIIQWDHFIGGDYPQQPVFHGYIETGL